MVPDAGACGWRTSIKSVLKGDEWHYGVAVSLSTFRKANGHFNIIMLLMITKNVIEPEKSRNSALCSFIRIGVRNSAGFASRTIVDYNILRYPNAF